MKIQIFPALNIKKKSAQTCSQNKENRQAARHKAEKTRFLKCVCLKVKYIHEMKLYKNRGIF